MRLWKIKVHSISIKIFEIIDYFKLLFIQYGAGGYQNLCTSDIAMFVLHFVQNIRGKYIMQILCTFLRIDHLSEIIK